MQLTQMKMRGRKAGKHHKFEAKTLRALLKDWQLYLLGHCVHPISTTVPNDKLKFTMPQVLRLIAFMSSEAQMLTIP